MGRDARERAVNNFTMQKVLGLHFKSYLNLALNTEAAVNVSQRTSA